MVCGWGTQSGADSNGGNGSEAYMVKQQWEDSNRRESVLRGMEWSLA
jgi:hypothetical protein